MLFTPNGLCESKIEIVIRCGSFSRAYELNLLSHTARVLIIKFGIIKMKIGVDGAGLRGSEPRRWLKIFNTEISVSEEQE